MAWCRPTSPSPSRFPTRARFSPRRTLLFLLLPLRPRALQDEFESRVAFVTRVLVDEIVGVPERHHQRPRARPGRRIVEGDFVVDRLRTYPGEALGELELLGSGPETGLQVAGLDHQGVALPPAARIAGPLVHACPSMGPVVQRNDA